MEGQRDKEGKFLPGCKPGPGRPKGSRNRLTEDFLKELSESFREHGPRAIDHVARNEPDKYLNIIGKLMPKLMELSGPDGSELPIGIVKFKRNRD